MNRRTFLRKSIYTLAGTAFAGGLYTWQVEPFRLEFVRHKMPVKNLPAHLVGKTLMQVSDLHVGKRFDYGYLIESLQKAKAYNPDFVVYTGDFVTLHKGEVLHAALAEVLQSSIQGKLGTVGILGNHDWGENWKQPEVADAISAGAASNGIPILRNAHQECAGLNFIGFDDYWGMNFNPDAAMRGYDSSKANIVLCHNPDVCDLPVWQNYQGWILAGHTHGGQVKPPFLDAPLVPVKNKNYTSGIFNLAGGRTLYINRALGHLWQVRFNARPEITIFELESG
jgi:predicted MPP superfamily phosphohydrolase